MAPTTYRRAVRDLRHHACAATVLVSLLAPAVEAEVPITASAAPGAAPQMAAPPANGELGFVFSVFTPAIYPGMKENCPDGWANLVRENYLTTLPPAEQKRLLDPANEAEFTERWKAYAVGPNHMNICTNYDQMEHPIQKTVQGGISYGLNLDGGSSGPPSDPYVCGHQKFTSPTGETGIDNQAYRALGCERIWRGQDGKAGDIALFSKSTLATGEYTIVLLLRGVHSLVNDDNVEVILASSPDRPVVDAKQNFIFNASFGITPNPRWRNLLNGRIVNGVLMTDPKDILLTRPIGLQGARGQRAEWDFGRSRLRLAFRPDGSLEGLIGGYQPLLSLIQPQVLGGIGSVNAAGIDCASEYATLQKLADGRRDPATGQCNAISSAWQVDAVPAFVFDRPEAGAKIAGPATP